MLGTILGFVTGLAGPISTITSKITDLKLAQVQAASNIEKAQIDQQIQESQDRKAVLLAEAGHRLSATLNAGVRMLLTLGPAAVLLKIFLWDKVVGSFAGCSGNMTPEMWEGCKTYVSDALDPNLWMVVMAVISFYFVYDIAARLKR